MAAAMDVEAPSAALPTGADGLITKEGFERFNAQMTGIPKTQYEAIMQQFDFSRYSTRVVGLWQHHNRLIGTPGFIVPAVFIAKAMGYNFAEEWQITDRLLKPHGERGVDFIPLKWEEALAALEAWPQTYQARIESAEVEIASDRQSAVMRIPGTGEAVLLRKGGNAKKHYFTTQGQAHYLAMRAQTEVGKDYAMMLKDVYEAVVLFVRNGGLGRPVTVPVAAPAPQGSLVPQTWQEQLEYERLKAEQQLELERLKTEKADALLKRRMFDTYEAASFALKSHTFCKRDQLFFEDLMANATRDFCTGRPPLSTVFGQGTVPAVADSAMPMVLDADQNCPNPNQGLQISDVFLDIVGRRWKEGELTAIGRRVAAAYRKRYNEDPPQNLRKVGGGEWMVNCYTEKDRDIIEQKVEEWAAELVGGQQTTESRNRFQQARLPFPFANVQPEFE